MTELAVEKVVAARPQAHWDLDPATSTVELSHKTLWGLMTVKGTFADVSGQAETSGSATGKAFTGSIHIRTASLDTHHSKRDEHLRSADFFASDQHPTIDFTVSSAAINGPQVAIDGLLAVRGISEALTVTARVAEADSDTVVLTVETQIDRARFGMSWNRIGMIRGNAHVAVKAVFHRSTQLADQ